MSLREECIHERVGARGAGGGRARYRQDAAGAGSLSPRRARCLATSSAAPEPWFVPKQISRCSPRATAVGIPTAGREPAPGQARVRAVVCSACVRAVLPSWCWRTCSGRMRPACRSWMRCWASSRISHCWFWPWVGSEVEERFPGLWGERMVEYIRLAPLPRKAGQCLVPPCGTPRCRPMSSTSCSSAGKAIHVPGRDGGRRRGGAVRECRT